MRLAPLSAKFASPPSKENQDPNPDPRPSSNTFHRSHSSYLQGKSAPTSPGILSRSSSRRHLGGGLSRRGSLYDNGEGEGEGYSYAAAVSGDAGAGRVEVGSGRIPKAKSEAALLVQRKRLSGQGQGVPPLMRRKQGYVLSTSKSGTSTPRPRRAPEEEDWLTRAGATTSAMLLEEKGQSWLSSRESATTLTNLASSNDEDEEEDDDNYEELAALSASTARLHFADDELSPSTTHRSGNWGSRYGSRSASRRTSRRGSMTGLRTPLANPDAMAGFFEEDALALPAEPDFVDVEDGDDQDEAAIARFTQDRGYGFGGLVDRLMGTSLFKVEEREESLTDDEVGVGKAIEGRERERERERHRMDAETLRATAPAEAGAREEQAEGGWRDAAWLLSVASKAMF